MGFLNNENRNTGADLGSILKAGGLHRTQRNNADWVSWMREVASLIVKKRGEVTTDDLRGYADEFELYPKSPNAWGSIFRTKEWYTIGFRRSRHPSNHARRICVWKSRKS